MSTHVGIQDDKKVRTKHFVLLDPHENQAQIMGLNLYDYRGF